MTRTLFYISLFIFIFQTKIFGQNSGTWTWMKGSDTAHVSGIFGVYGQLGVPDPSNTPPALYEAVEFTDLQGRFWIYGGLYDIIALAHFWMFDPATNNWTCMNGSNTQSPNLLPDYGIQGVPSSTNHPGIRSYGTLSWTDNDGNLWLFGGASSVFGGLYNDLWKYDISTNEWTWMKGADIPNDPGSYGAMGVPAISNNPPARCESAASWTDNNGDLWLYGGNAFNSERLGDLWRYQIASNTWTWMGGSSVGNAPPVYGTQGVASPSNSPGGRCTFARWKDAEGNLWMYGGFSSNYNFQDMWKYDVSTQQWTWVAGPQGPISAQNNPYIFQSSCAPANGIPPPLMENRANWVDDCGRFWCYGGFDQLSFSNAQVVYDVLWVFDPVINEFFWMGGNAFPSASQANFGTLGVSSPTNYPPPLSGSVGFKDLQSNFWMFGGVEFSFSSNQQGFYNTLWKFVPDDQCLPSPLPPAASIVASPVDSCSPLLFSFQLGNVNPAFSYAWNFGDTLSSDNIASSPNPLHHFSNPGIYIITLVSTSVGACFQGSDTTSFLLDLSSVSPLSFSFSASACDSYTAPWGAIYTQSGSYSDTTTSVNGCDSIVTLNLLIGSSLPTLDSIVSCGPYTFQNGLVYTSSTSFDTILISSIGCDSLVSYIINILPAANALASPGDVSISLGDAIQLNASGGNTYQWSPSDGLSCTNCPSPMASPQASIVYVVSTTNSSGCSDTASVRVKVDIKCKELFIPDIFTPNGDGPVANEKLCAFSNCVRLFSFIIYNRWGEQVFETTDITSCWDGTYKGKEAQVGIYAYKLYAEQIDGSVVDQKGTITLIR